MTTSAKAVPSRRRIFDSGTKSQVFTSAPAGFNVLRRSEYSEKATSTTSRGYSRRALASFGTPPEAVKQSVRVSGAILRDTAELFYAERLTTNSPYGTAIDIPNPTGGFTNPYLGYPGGNPFPLLRLRRRPSSSHLIACS